MNSHVNDAFADCLRGHFNLPRDVDHFAREEAKRERDYERRLLCHPDPRDPEHPGDDE